MTSATPWSVKGIDPKAREVAKDLARRSGMTLGEWLNRMILEDVEDEGPEEITSQAYFSQRPERGYIETPRAAEPAPRTPPSRFEAPQHPADEIGRIGMALDRLSGKLDQGGGHPRIDPAPTATELAVREALVRLEVAERENIAVAARFEGAVQEARGEQARLAERLRRIELEASGPRSAEALRSLEAALGKVATHLYEGEGRTRETLEVMEQRIEELSSSGWGDPASLIEEVASRVDARLSDAETRTAEALIDLGKAFANLDTRVETVENGASPAIEERLTALSTTLSQRVEQVRGEIAQKLQAAADGRFDRMETKLGEMAETVRKAEATSGQAIEKMGREVLTMADTLNRRVQATEQRSADAIDQVGGEVARIAQAMETRLGRSEGVHAEALERLGLEIGKITERLAERIGSSERRAAQAIDDVGEQVARVSERIQQRHERSSEDLSERIRLSEERTARLLDEAREKIDRSLAESQRRLAEQVAAATPPRAAEPPSPFDADPFADFGPAEPAADPLALQAFAAPGAPPEARIEPAAPFPSEPERPAFDAADFEAADGFAPIETVSEEVASPFEEVEARQPEAPAIEAEPEQLVFDTAPAASAAEEIDLDATQHDFPELEDEALDEPPLQALDQEPDAAPEEEPSRPLSTREVIEQARAAARAAASTGDAKKAKGRLEKFLKPSDKLTKPDKAAKPAGKSLFSGFGARPPKRAAGSALHSALLVAGGAAFLSLGAAGIIVMDGQPGGEPPQRVADALATMKSQGGEIAGAEADTTPFPDSRAAVALAPTSITALPATPEVSAELATLYADAVSAIETKQAGGLESLRKAANLGHSPAQFYLAKLYEKGEAGLKADPAEARRWTERAAQGGNRHAMHNLGIAFINGDGGPKNSTTAAQWFRRAADLGLVDSQFNLGALYEQGLGVSQNAAEAYKWYLIAAKAGDEGALKSAARVRSGLSGEARSIAETAARSYRPTTPNPSLGTASIMAPAPTVATAQRALSKLGYYEGPVDGVPSPALKMAIVAYQRYETLPPTGALDPATVSRLQVFTR
ncbi:peptidoglycan-binding protein [Phenylobacterium sp. LH3H17]|uniref:peptidoglycan-binding protein n=1 Tax=Phenylobacterium sp. LH3H17 TaxID=2903901 RepID=UPI0020C94258|nr:peptidoglycan-binding protein [Phenylobacterium sp. LH3H17]UTP40478.1 peptidoglycan-binding protein [Phenylobacterium sp. LH3H17]